MKTELRLGNWVFDVGTLHQVAGIEDLACELKNPPPYTATHAQLWEFIKPVPLTEEWLLKFGFWKRENSNVWNTGVGNYRYCIHQTSTLYPFDVISSDSSYFVDTPKYVHQLQNLFFALTREELTIT